MQEIGDVFSISLKLNETGEDKPKLLIDFLKMQLDKYNCYEYNDYKFDDDDDNDDTDYYFHNDEYSRCKYKKYMRKDEYFSKQLREQPRAFHR